MGFLHGLGKVLKVAAPLGLMAIPGIGAALGPALGGILGGAGAAGAGAAGGAAAGGLGAAAKNIAAKGALGLVGKALAGNQQAPEGPGMQPLEGMGPPAAAPVRRPMPDMSGGGGTGGFLSGLAPQTLDEDELRRRAAGRLYA